MTVFTLMSNQATPGGTPTPVSVPGNPTKAEYTLSLTGPLTGYCMATVLASANGQVFLPIFVMKIEAGGPNTITEGLREPGGPGAVAYIQYDAILNNIAPGGQTATLTMNV